jgi:hypothetical protein
MDYRDLNKIVVPESQPFPLIDEVITWIQGCLWFSVVDINSAFYSILIHPEDRFKTAFVTQQGHYEWSQLPFGLKNAPAIFQRILSTILRKYNLSSFCVNYLDDVLIFSKTFEDHILHLKLLFNAIKSEGFKLKLVKCDFAKHTINYLGHRLSPNSVQPLSDNLTAINDFPVPKSRRNIREFLGKINFYRKFLPQSALLLEPFHALLRKNVPFVWSSQCAASFLEVKRLLTSAPILAVFDPANPTLIYTDASGLGIGAVLKQIQPDGMEKPVAFFSRKLVSTIQEKSNLFRKFCH